MASARVQMTPCGPSPAFPMLSPSLGLSPSFSLAASHLAPNTPAFAFAAHAASSNLASAGPELGAGIRTPNLNVNVNVNLNPCTPSLTPIPVEGSLPVEVSLPAAAPSTPGDTVPWRERVPAHKWFAVPPPSGSGGGRSLAGLRLPPLAGASGPRAAPWTRPSLLLLSPIEPLVKPEPESATPTKSAPSTPKGTRHGASKSDAGADAPKRARTAAAKKEDEEANSKRRLKEEGRGKLRTRGRGPASEEESEQKRQHRIEAKKQKELERATEKRERTVRRLRKHMMKLGLKASTIDATLANSMTTADAAGREHSSAPPDLVDLSILPVGHNLPLQPLQVPFDAFSFDGRFGISVLCTSTGRRDVPTICRFNFTPKDDAPVLIGPAGMGDAAEALLYPSLCAAAKRANLKPGTPLVERALSRANWKLFVQRMVGRFFTRWWCTGSGRTGCR